MHSSAVYYYTTRITVTIVESCRSYGIQNYFLDIFSDSKFAVYTGMSDELQVQCHKNGVPLSDATVSTFECQERYST